MLLLHVVRSLDGHKENIDAGLPGETGRLLHLVRGPAVHQHHRHVGRAPAVAIGVREVVPVDVAEGLSCPCARGQQKDSQRHLTHSRKRSRVESNETHHNCPQVFRKRWAFFFPFVSETQMSMCTLGNLSPVQDVFGRVTQVSALLFSLEFWGSKAISQGKKIILFSPGNGPG